MDEPADNNQSTPQKQDIPSPQSQSPDDHSQPSSDSATVQDTAKANDNSTTNPTNNSATVSSTLNDIWTKITTVSSSVMHSIDNQFHDVMDSMHAFQSRFRSHGGTEEYTGTWILGKKYEENQMEFMKKDIRSRPWFTYRHSFSPIKGTNFSTDTGWGYVIKMILRH
ncbi:hypothetical protein BKA69DRAFT_1053770 [Paraphysoderma sedebokerense]|nr:hypothetical protein BKA69DRAFT_1053770 [Paraphysoderma sedebokerense]